MPTIILIAFLAALFVLLGKTADVIVVRIRKLGELFNVRVFFLGITLGLFTTLPEFSIAVNALITDALEISLGNLLGSIIVLFSLILGGSIILNKTIGTDGKIGSAAPILVYLFLPVLASLDGDLNLFEGTVFIVGYFLIISHLFRKNKNHEQGKRVTIKKSTLLKSIFIVLAGIVFVILISNLIIRITLGLLENLQVPAFLIGLLAFSIGTNLPELAIMIRSWRRKTQELSVGNLMGSAITHVLIIGVLAFTQTIPIALNASYLSLVFFIAFTLAIFGYFYKTDHAFTRREGILLLASYFVFVANQILLFAFIK